MSIRYFTFDSATYELTPQNLLGQQIIRKYGHCNKDNNETLTKEEILESFPLEDRNEAAGELAKAADILRSLEAVPTLRLSADKFKSEMVAALKKRLKTKVPIDIDATSTYDKDSRDGDDRKRTLAQTLSILFTKAYGITEVDAKKLGDAKIKKANTLINIDPPAVFYFFDPELKLPSRRILFSDASGEIVQEVYIYHKVSTPGFFSILLPPLSLLMGLSFINKYREDLTKAGEILESHHPKITKGNLTSLNAYSFAIEIANFQAEDIVQDVGACRAVDCAVLSGYQEAFPTGLGNMPWLHGIGDRIGWELASFFKHDKKTQGYGIGQIILGLALEAAGDEELLKDYAPHIDKSDFSDEESALRAIFDPKKLIYVKALTLDYVIKKLETSLFAEPASFTLPIDWACPLLDRKTAREVNLLLSASLFQALPERTRHDGNYPLLDPSFSDNLADKLWIGELSGFPLNLNGVSLLKKRAVFALTPDMKENLSRLNDSDGIRVEEGQTLLIDCK